MRRLQEHVRLLHAYTEAWPAGRQRAGEAWPQACRLACRDAALSDRKATSSECDGDASSSSGAEAGWRLAASAKTTRLASRSSAWERR